MNYGPRVLELRTRKKLSQRKLGALVGLDQAQISRLENGNGDVATSKLIEIAKVLGVSMVGFWNGVAA